MQDNRPTETKTEEQIALERFYAQLGHEPRRSTELPEGIVPIIETRDANHNEVRHAALVIARKRGMSQNGITICGVQFEVEDDWVRGFAPPEWVNCPACIAARSVSPAMKNTELRIF